MGDRSSIEWTEATWNPVTGCDRVSAGCDNCYALAFAKRLKAMGSPHYQTDGDPVSSGPGFALRVHRDALDVPYRWRTPRVIFVNSMSDLFHPEVPDSFIAEVFAVMADTPRHKYQVLTKRSQRLARLAASITWPDNVWMGVSVETERYAFRVRHLRSVPAAVRFVSAEPMLGPLESIVLRDVDWVIAGGESGHKARPMHPQWVGDLRDRCLQDGVAFFFKQWGAWAPYDGDGSSPVTADGTVLVDTAGAEVLNGAVSMRRLSKSAAGRLLDGRTWDQMPRLS